VGDGSTSDSPATGANKGPCPPGQTRVAVLNGTPTPGLAATFAGPLKQRGYRTSPVGNTDSPFTTSVVMFDPQQQGKECAAVISEIVGIPKQQPMDNEIRIASEGDPVAVILGDDKAGSSGASTTGSGI
jgi:LytR cell envelope-related transcriptional attenuator